MQPRIRKYLRRGWIALGSLLGLLIVFYLVAHIATDVRLAKTWDVKSQFKITATPTSIENGKHLATAIGKCVDCHGTDFAGKVIFDQPIFGRVVAANLTGGAGSRTKNWSDAQWDLAIRHGIGPDGKGLVIMPSKDNYHFTDQELSDLICYIKSLPQVNTAHPTTEAGPLARVLYTLGQMPLLNVEEIDHTARRSQTLAEGVTIERGAHLAETGGCTGCHGAKLVGGPIPGAPPDFPHARNLTPDVETGLGKWTKQDIYRVLREGKRPSGDTLNPTMPWRFTAMMKDDEIDALWLYLRSIPPLKGEILGSQIHLAKPQ